LSAAQIAAANPTFFHEEAGCAGASQILLELTHDLRQPLSAIEAITYYLEMTIPGELTEARNLLGRLQKLLENADEMLARAEGSQRPHS